MGAKNSAQSRDSQKLNSFYSGIPTEAKLASLENKVAKSKSKYAVRFFVMGFLLEYAFGVGSFYENLNRKSTLRRLSISPITQTPRRRKTMSSSRSIESKKGPDLSDGGRLHIIALLINIIANRYFIFES